jgi:hypothetical protein
MKRKEDRRAGTGQAATAEQARRQQAWDTGWQTIRGLLRLCVLILAALLGAAAVEAIRAIL